ncbi:2Fe-2S iron-sulfur cluster-binding protein [Halobacterium wangiae]|uniref:2Fe-2S iron-sulfur cluster-binding protein n=1 Tax=Halobacterium wangiae TaxID=2902623 RepID=UPI001E28F011|nr:2Fe-2S iron-sulfur cluster-binding protein [Halobacterium wangiae]
MSYSVELVVPEDCELPQAGETVDVEVPEDEYVLWAAREAGVWLPADCQQGWCCRCAGELLSGELDQSDSRRYFDTDREAALHLLCTAIPRSDCRIRVCQYEEMLDERARQELPPGNSKR